MAQFINILIILIMTRMTMCRCVSVWNAWWREEERLVEFSPLSPALLWRCSVMIMNNEHDLNDEEENNDGGARL